LEVIQGTPLYEIAALGTIGEIRDHSTIELGQPEIALLGSRQGVIIASITGTSGILPLNVCRFGSFDHHKHEVAESQSESKGHDGKADDTPKKGEDFPP